MGQLGVLGCIAVLGSDGSQVQSWADDGVDFLHKKVKNNSGFCFKKTVFAYAKMTCYYLLRGAGCGEPEPGSVGGDADHGAAGHEVADSVGPPGIVVALVHQVLPGNQLQHTRTTSSLSSSLINKITHPSHYR